MHHLICRVLLGGRLRCNSSPEKPCRTGLLQGLPCTSCYTWFQLIFPPGILGSTAIELGVSWPVTNYLECEVWSINQCMFGTPRHFCSKGFRLFEPVGAFHCFPCCPSMKLSFLLWYGPFTSWMEAGCLLSLWGKGLTGLLVSSLPSAKYRVKASSRVSSLVLSAGHELASLASLGLRRSKLAH